MNDLRAPFLFFALFLWVLVLGLDMGAELVIVKPNSIGGASNGLGQFATDLGIDTSGDSFKKATSLKGKEDPPGLGIASLALIDGILLFALFWIAQALLFSQRVMVKFHGVSSLVFSILVLISSIAVIFMALTKLLLMVAMFLAVPFGTLAYLAIYGSFAKGAAATILSLSMFLRLGFAVCLVLAQQSFLKNKSLVFLYLTCLLAPFVVTLLHAIVPGILVSITDAVAAIVVAVLAVIWALVTLVGSLSSITKLFSGAT